MSKRYCPKCSSTNIKPTKDKAQSGKVRWQCECKHRTTRPLTRHPEHQNGINLTDISSKTLVITSAMANTDTHKETLGVLLNYCDANDAQFLVIPVKYRNPDNMNSYNDEPLTYDKQLEPYLLRKNYKVNKNLTIFAERSINATRKRPLTGKETRAKESSGIFAHSQLCMTVTATAKDKIPKILHTTGSVSLPTYSNSDMGDDATMAHTLGAVVVEVQGNKFFLRQLMVKDGVVYDLNKKYTQNTVEDARPELIVYGDTHHKLISAKEYATIWGKRGLYNTLKPKVQVFHDLLDFYADNHHHQNEPLLQFKKTLDGDECIETELKNAVKFLDKVGGGVIVQSNHNDHLTQWVNKVLKSGLANTVSYRNMPIMAELTHMATTHIAEHGNIPSVLNIYLEKYCKAPLVFPSRNQEYRPVFCDLSQHGDKGANGAKGSMYAFLKSGVPTTIGHGHTPFIINGFNGVWGVGVTTMNMGYATGLSGWLYAHVTEYENGQRQMIITIDGKFRPYNKTKKEMIHG